MASRPAAAPRLTREERQRQTRSCLLRSAAKVFARRGLEGASIDEVAADAGFTKGAFYANFASKQDCFLAMLDERFAERVAQLEALTAAEDGLEQQVRSAASDFTRYLSSDRDWERLFFEFAAYAARDEAFRVELVKRYRGLREGMAAVFERRLSELGVRSPVPVEQLVLMTFSLGNGFALERLLEPEAAPAELFSDALVLLLQGVRAQAQTDDAALGAPDRF